MRKANTYWICVLTVAVSVLSASAAEFEWRPISATGPNNITDNTIVLQGGGQEVRVDLLMSGWDPDLNGDPLVGAFQASIDSAGYTSGAGGALVPVGWPATPGDGAFQATTLCTVNQQADPNGPPCQGPADCTAGEFCIPNFEWVFDGIPAVAAIATATLDYEFAAAAQSGGRADDGTTVYGGTVLLTVPTDAAGTYIIGFIDDPNSTFLRDSNALIIPGVVLTPITISIACAGNADCDDGSACTDDVCNPDQTCSNTNNYDDTQFCCNPATSNLTPLSDNNDCTGDICDTDTGAVTHPALPPGSACGDPTGSDCDDPDTCNGLGTCATNFVASGTLCGDPVATDCNAADACDGAGSCSPNIAPAGTLCGDSSDTQCDDPDTCNGTGTCLPNNEPDGTTCNDGSFCSVGESCVGGACGNASPRDCGDGLPCTTDSCDDVGSTCVNTLDGGNCLILGVCFADGAINPDDDCEECNESLVTDDWSLRPDGSICDDGNPCTGTGRPGIGDDTCDATGLCSGTEDPECNDDCEFAIEAQEGATLSDNTGAGPDDAEASCQVDSNADVWFVYEAKCDGMMNLSTSGTLLQPSNDPVLSVYDACGGNELACDDDSGVGLQALVKGFATTAGTQYWIRVAGFEDNTGSIVLNIDIINDCVIDGVCYEDGDRNPVDECQMCRPGISTSNWSFAWEGASCGDPTDTVCDSPDACDGAGVCETNFKPDGTMCPDDGNDCSLDVCGTGLCTHPPQPAGTPCDDGTSTECDDPDSCNDSGVCLPNFVAAGAPCGDASGDQCDNPDICDGSGDCDPNFVPIGTTCIDGDVCTGNDVCAFGSCSGTAIPVAPLVVAEAPRAIHATPQPSGNVPPVALRISSPDWPCLNKYVDADGSLVGAPVLQVPDAWGTVVITGEDIVPSSEYRVWVECGSYISPPGSDSTCLWADVDCSGTTNFQDVQFIILGFQHDFGPGVSFEALDIWPCAPNGVINFVDVQRAILAWQGESYQDTGCPVPCP